MSQRNGDRARADRQRKAKLHERTRIRAFRQVTQQHAPKSIDHDQCSNVDKSGPEAVPVLEENQ
jgi:hypothetical protein